LPQSLETCTQYLFRTIDDLARPGFDGAKYVYTPPPRDKANQDVLWNAVRTDILSAVSTDHCAFLWDGQKTRGSDDFTKIPNGAAGARGPARDDPPLRRRRRSHLAQPDGRPPRTQPAKLFGLYPRKGTIKQGTDADIVIFDPAKEHTLSAATHRSRADYNLYEGTMVTGAVDLTIVRGNVIVEGGELVAEPGIAQFVKRARFGEKVV